MSTPSSYLDRIGWPTRKFSPCHGLGSAGFGLGLGLGGFSHHQPEDVRGELAGTVLNDDGWCGKSTARPLTQFEFRWPWQGPLPTSLRWPWQGPPRIVELPLHPTIADKSEGADARPPNESPQTKAPKRKPPNESPQTKAPKRKPPNVAP